MEFQTVLENRRSVRSYDASKTVTTEQIKKIIEAGILAPSRKNSGTACFFACYSENPPISDLQIHILTAKLLVSPFIGRHSFLLLKYTGKMCQIQESYCIRNISDANGRIL